MNGVEIAVVAIVLSAGALFWISRDRLFPSLYGRRARRRRERVEDALKCLHDLEYEGRRAVPDEVARRLGLRPETTRIVLRDLAERKLIEIDSDECRLLPEGREYASQVVRAHRLWETYLAEQTGIDEYEWHRRAHRREHELSPEELDELAARIGNPTHDPHGDPIPTAEGELPSPQGFPLSRLTPGQSARVLHIEDEPAHVYARIRAEGLFPGLEVQALENSTEGIRLSSGGNEHRIEASAAASVTVQPQASPPAQSGRVLSDLKAGEEGVVASISKACRPALRRRLMDLGVLPGTLVRAELRSPAGDPVAYRVRGTLIGLRTEQAQHIRIDLPQSEAS